MGEDVEEEVTEGDFEADEDENVENTGGFGQLENG